MCMSSLETRDGEVSSVDAHTLSEGCDVIGRIP